MAAFEVPGESNELTIPATSSLFSLGRAGQMLALGVLGIPEGLSLAEREAINPRLA